MGDAIGTFEDITELEPRWKPVLRALRAMAFALHPDLVETARPGDRAVSWGWGARKMIDCYACALPYKRHVNLGFYRGTLLADPAGRLKGTGTFMRHVAITAPGQIEDDAIRRLMIDAREERRQALGL